MLEFKNLKMKRAIILKIIVLGFLFSACVKDSDFSTPSVECNEPEIIVTNTIQQVKEMYRYGGATVIETEVVIEGYVISSDQQGNFEHKIVIQNYVEYKASSLKHLTLVALYLKFYMVYYKVSY